MRIPGTTLGLILLLACSPGSPEPQSAKWDTIVELEQRASALENEESADLRQAFADALHEFVLRNPEHAEARKKYERLELEFARELAANGRLTSAAIQYGALLARDPGNAEAAEELAGVDARRRLAPEILGQLSAGMTPDEVEAVLGAPPSGWKRSLSRENQETESWLYPVSNGVAMVHFVNGELLTVDY